MRLGRFLKTLLSGLFILAVLFVASVEYSSYLSSGQSSESSGTTKIDQYSLESLKAAFLFVGKEISRVFGNFVDLVERKDKLIVALSTIFIALFTTVLGLFTISLAGSTRRAAEAAKESSEALTQSERAQLFVVLRREDSANQIKTALQLSKMYDHPTSVTDQVISGTNYVSCVFKNYGKTPAIIKEFSLHLAYFDELPFEPVYIPRDAILNEYMIAASGETDLLKCPFDAPITMQQGNKVLHAHAYIWFYGRIVYDDCFRKEHEHRFLWRYGGAHGFRPIYEHENYIKNT